MPSNRPAPDSNSNPPPSSAPPAATTAEDVPIVGVGLSAGGLSALETLLAEVPPACGMSFVVVQHLNPTSKCMLAELLKRVTILPVVEITDAMPVRHNHVYVLPPSKDVSLRHGRLHLKPAVTHGGLRLPIDHFFRSLADDRQERAVGVILSGMGSDGTLGLRAIKECAGAVFVQAPETAKFDSMPRSAIDAGLADVVAPPQEIPQRILAYLRHLESGQDAEAALPAKAAPGGLERIVRQLRIHTGHDFSLYKSNTLYRRIERRMGLHQIAAVSDYAAYLRENPHELELLFRELLIGVTRFFRDPEVWEQLAKEVIPAMIAARPDGGSLRAWVPGCSTGEEAYSLAIVFCEVLERLQPPNPYTVQIFATDLDSDAIDLARIGAYPRNVRADISPERLRRFFVEDESGFRVRSEVREKITFAPQNVVMDPPFTRMDLLSCRNLLIYLEPELQKKLLSLFHYSLRADGFLVLGAAETIGDSTRLFAPLPGKAHVYLRLDGDPRTHSRFPAALNGPGPGFAFGFGAHNPSIPAATSAPNFRALTETLLIQRYCPAAVLTNDAGDIVYVSGKTGKFLEPAAGKANLNVFAMAREGLGSALNGAFFRALRQKVRVTLNGIAVGTNGGSLLVDLALYPVSEPGGLRDMVLITFAECAPQGGENVGEVAPGRRSQADFSARTEELARCREELLATREEMQTSQEELRSVNEELQSANEELYSANEELMTSKEEMQSMNEELRTINHELRTKVSQFWQVDDDMQNLLNSTTVAALFLDDALRVRRYTGPVTSIFKLIPGDAGRPITDLVTALDYPALADDVREVLRSLVIHECEVSTSDQRSFAVRIAPYRTQDNRIDGVVIVFTDRSGARRQHEALRGALAALRAGTEARHEGEDAAPGDGERLRKALRAAQRILERELGAGGD